MSGYLHVSNVVMTAAQLLGWCYGQVHVIEMSCGLPGPPGIGKTAAVLQVAALLGAECERINFSSSTTFEQLFGMYVPQYLNGRRVFAWQPGKMSQAIKAGKWLLLDELNLASAEVLDRIASHLDALHPDHRNTSGCDTPRIHIFATMNPASIGGGRMLLPRSIRNMFMNVQLQASFLHSTLAGLHL